MVYVGHMGDLPPISSHAGSSIRTAVVLLALVATAVPLQAGPKVLQKFVLREYLGHTWTNELISFPLGKESAAGAGGFSLRDPDGQEMPFQIVPGADGCRIAFLVNLPKYARIEYQLVQQPPQRGFDADIRLEEKEGTVRLLNRTTGVEVPTEKGRYDSGPVLGLRMRSGRWIGGSRLVLDRKISSYECRVLARGPVFGEVESLYKFEGDKHWRIRFRVIAGEPVVLLSEEFDLGDGSRWEVLVHPEFKPSHAFYRPSNLEPCWKGRIEQNFVFPLQYANDPTPLVLFAWLPWNTAGYASFLGVFRAEDGVTFARDEQKRSFVPVKIPKGKQTAEELDAKKAELTEEEKEFEEGVLGAPKPDEDPRWDDMLAAAAGHGATWARAGENGQAKGVPLRATPDGQLYFVLQLAGPAREWLLASVSVKESVVPDAELSVPQKLMVKYCETPLDEVKDMVLEWAAPESDDYPRLALCKDDVVRLRQAGKKSQDGSPYGIVKNFLISGDPALRKKAAELAKAAMAEAVGAFVPGSPNQPSGTAYTHHHANRIRDAETLADGVLGTDALTLDEKLLIRAQLAFLGYKIGSEHFLSPSRGHCANPNMTTSRTCALCLLACLISSHPMAKEWVKGGLAEVENELANWTGPNGGWLEAPHYQTVAMCDILYIAFATKHAGFADYLHDQRLSKAITYCVKISTPRDPDFNNRRHFPPIGNTYIHETTNLSSVLARLERQRNPELADGLQWMYLEHGKPGWSGIGGWNSFDAYAEFLVDDAEPREAPNWGSEHFVGSGAVLRSGFQSDRETYMYLIQGWLHAHYDDDQGSFELWGKGRPLCLDWGYHGCMPAWQHSRMDIGGGGKISEFAALAQADYVHSEQGGWDRQILFAKDADPLGPNYFLIRDSTTGKGTANWWLWLYTEDHPRREGDVITVKGRHDVDLDIHLDPASTKLLSWLKRGELQQKEPKLEANVGDEKKDVDDAEVEFDLAPEKKDELSPYVRTVELTIGSHGMDAKGNQGMQQTKQRGLHLIVPRGQPVVSVLYPRLREAKRPGIRQIADGRGVEIASPRRGGAGTDTDFAFLALKPFEFREGDVYIKAKVGLIRLREGEVILSLPAGGEIGYGKHNLASEKPESRRFPAR